VLLSSSKTPEIVTQKHQRLLLKNTRNCYSKTPEIVTLKHQKLLFKYIRDCYSKTPEIVTGVAKAAMPLNDC
jgi:hypothetical protein